MSTDAIPSVVNQTTFYLAFLITLASAGAIVAQIIRGINSRIKKNREETEAKAAAENAEVKKYVDDKMQEVNETKDRVEYIYRRMIDKYFNHDKKDVPSN